jgi:hypothetical protein
MEAILHFLRRLRVLAFRRQFNREPEEEMIFHREQAEKELQSEGIPSDVAHNVANRQFGNQTRMKEQSQEVVALGAQRLDVLGLVLSRAATLVLAGTAVGIVLSLALSRLLQDLIYDVSASDPLTFTSAGLIVIFVAIPACYIPARRATQADPITALRAE